ADPGEGARAGRPVVRAPGHRPHGAVVDVHGGQPQRGAGGQPADGQDGLLAVVLEVGAEAGEGAGVVVRVERRLDDLAQDEARLLAAGEQPGAGAAGRGDGEEHEHRERAALQAPGAPGRPDEPAEAADEGERQGGRLGGGAEEDRHREHDGGRDQRPRRPPGAQRDGDGDEGGEEAEEVGRGEQVVQGAGRRGEGEDLLPGRHRPAADRPDRLRRGHEAGERGAGGAERGAEHPGDEEGRQHRERRPPPPRAEGGHEGAEEHAADRGGGEPATGVDRHEREEGEEHEPGGDEHVEHAGAQEAQVAAHRRSALRKPRRSSASSPMVSTVTTPTLCTAVRAPVTTWTAKARASIGSTAPAARRSPGVTVEPQTSTTREARSTSRLTWWAMLTTPLGPSPSSRRVRLSRYCPGVTARSVSWVVSVVRSLSSRIAASASEPRVETATSNSSSSP